MLHVFWNTLDSLYSRRGARKPWTSIRTERPTIPDQESQGHAARPRTTRFHNQRGVRARARGPGRGQGTSAPTDWFRSRGNGDWALETRLAEQPCRGNSQGNAKLARKRAGSDLRISRLECKNRTAASPSKHPDEIFRCAEGAGLCIVFHYVEWVHWLGNRQRRGRSL